MQRALLEQIAEIGDLISPDTTLIVQCTLNYVYTPEEWDLLMSQAARS
jgi:hypothetical protein